MELDPLGWRRPDFEIPGMLIFSKVWGSHSHDTHLPTSDVDYLGVYLAWNKNLLGLDKAPDTFDGKKPDFQLHEVGKFAALLLKGNPGILEMLFSDRMYWCDPVWRWLQENKTKFLSQTAVYQYLGYCQGQLKKLANGTYLGTTGGDYNTKWAYHMIRLAGDAERIARGGEPRVWKDGEEKEELMAIRAGEWSKDRVINTTLERIHRIESLKPWPIPEDGDKAFLNHWLLSVRGLEPWEA